MYKLCFPRTIDGKLRIAIFPDECGFVNNQWWHVHLKKEFNSALDALALAEEIVNARREQKPCPCGEDCEKASETVGTGTVFEEDEKEEIHLD